MQLPTQQLKKSVMDLLTYEGSNDMTSLTLPDLIQLMCDHDESVVARAVHRAYILSREDSAAMHNPEFIEALINASRSVKFDTAPPFN